MRCHRALCQHPYPSGLRAQATGSALPGDATAVGLGEVALELQHRLRREPAAWLGAPRLKAPAGRRETRDPGDRRPSCSGHVAEYSGLGAPDQPATHEPQPGELLPRGFASQLAGEGSLVSAPRPEETGAAAG